VTTVVAAGSTGVQVSEQDIYTLGVNFWTTSVTITNPQAAAVTRITHARDCYLAGSDTGTGQADPATSTTYCQGKSAALGLTPNDPGSTWAEGGYSAMWAIAMTDADLPKTFVPTAVDNGQALSWKLSPGATTTRRWSNLIVTGPGADLVGGVPNPSLSSTLCSTSRPVNCATGDFWHTFTDVAIPAHGLTVGVNRAYDLVNSQTSGRFGFGWHDSLDMKLTVSADVATIVQENGSPVSFTRRPDGTWGGPPYVLATLTATAGSWTFTRRQDLMSYGFSAAGRLTSMTALSGEAIRLFYNARSDRPCWAVDGDAA
jgi:hypothetical protein